ncbi:CIC11C00000000342 [Sungouiella intermedia]|uniref:CIC11C00000000342 n=1 Tax=Sungouiella intermedia TaxID=45354 RepID=A0A1L0BY23_9ASCO|nr:CIC11C00000000342 [[Candida] intermedia]
MFGFGDQEDAHAAIYGEQHEGKFSHELVAGGASFAAFKMFEDRQRREGKPVSHAFAKEMLAGIVGGEVDKLFETKGLDYLDRDEAKRRAYENVEQSYDQHYGGQEQWHPDSQPPFDYQDQRYNY